MKGAQIYQKFCSPPCISSYSRRVLPLHSHKSVLIDCEQFLPAVRRSCLNLQLHKIQGFTMLTNDEAHLSTFPLYYKQNMNEAGCMEFNGGADMTALLVGTNWLLLRNNGSLVGGSQNWPNGSLSGSLFNPLSCRHLLLLDLHAAF